MHKLAIAVFVLAITIGLGFAFAQAPTEPAPAPAPAAAPAPAPAPAPAAAATPAPAPANCPAATPGQCPVGNTPGPKADKGSKMMAADTNKDGKVSLDEMKTIAPNMTPEKFKALDRNGDGFVSKEDRGGGKAGKGGPKAGKGGPKAGQGAKIGQRANAPGKPGANFAERMKKADANNDGKVTYEEMKATAPRLTQERFNAMDKNKDGAITPEDRPIRAQAGAPATPAAPGAPAAAGAQTNDPAAKKALARARAQEQMVKADADKDGKVSLEELQKVNPKVTPEKFKKMDKNGDGFITKEDRKQKPAA